MSLKAFTEIGQKLLVVAITATLFILIASSAFAQSPATPQNFTVEVTTTGSGSHVVFTWDSVNAADTYALSYGTSPNNPIESINVGTVQSIGFDAPHNLLIYVAVIAVNSSGNSDPSNELEVSTALPLPDIPQNLSGQIQGTTVSLNWSSVPAAQSYNLYFRAARDDAAAMQGPFPLGETNSLDINEVPVGDYVIGLTASNETGESSLSNLIEINPTNQTNISCPADDVDLAQLFTASPMEIDDATELIPLGNVAPASHVLAVDHMYVHHSDFGGDGSIDFEIYSMGNGEIYLIEHRINEGIDDFDLYIKHSCNVSSYFFHLSALSDKILSSIDDDSWVDVFGDGSTRIVFFGQQDGPEFISLNAGEQVGESNNRLIGYDIGVIDRRWVNGHFENTNGFRYADFGDYLTALPLADGVDFDYYGLGNKSINSACFLDYLTSENDLQLNWREKLVSQNLSCGKNGWDVANRLQGHWFNPEIENLSGFLFDVEVAALAIVPYNRDPENQIIIGFGNAASAFDNADLAILDPVNWEPPVTGVDQIRTGFNFIFDPNSETVNPDPATVPVSQTVCYDLPTPDGFKNYILFHLESSDTLRVLYDPSDFGSTQCNSLANGGFPNVDSEWVTFIR